MKIKGRRSIVVDDNAGAGNPPPDVPPDPGDVTPPPPPPPPPPEPEGGTVDLILISIGYEVWNGSTWVAPTGPLTVGQIFRPTSVAKNQGTATMPAGATSPPPGTQLDVAYFYSGDNTYITWSDQYTATLGPGASTTMAATGGDHPSNDNRPYFTAVAGTHTLTGQVNSYGPPRKTESDYSNNTRATTITVEGAGSPPAGPQDTIVWGNAGSVSLYASLINGTPVSGSMLLAHGIKGVVGMGAGNWWDPFYDDFFPDYVIAAGLYWSVGMHLGHSPKPTSSGNVSTLISQFTSLCASGAAAGAVFPTLDCEPYDGPDNMWNVEVSAVDAAALGTGIGNAILAQGWTRVALYTSSNASWPGSYNDELQWEVNGVHPYDTSKFPNFLTALCNTGVIVEHTDAAFHFGPQRSGFTWDTGCADTVARAEAFHPNMRGSIMYWPDIDEGGLAGGYDDGVTEAAAAASLAHSTGLIHLYQHHMGDPDYVSSNSGQTWFGSGGYLDEVLAGLT